MASLHSQGVITATVLTRTSVSLTPTTVGNATASPAASSAVVMPLSGARGKKNWFHMHRVCCAVGLLSLLLYCLLWQLICKA